MKKKTWSCGPYTIKLIETGDQTSSLLVLGPISNTNPIHDFDESFDDSLEDAEGFVRKSNYAVERGYSILGRWFMNSASNSEIHVSRVLESSDWEFSRIIKGNTSKPSTDA